MQRRIFTSNDTISEANTLTHKISETEAKISLLKEQINNQIKGLENDKLENEKLSKYCNVLS